LKEVEEKLSDPSEYEKNGPKWQESYTKMKSQLSLEETNWENLMMELDALKK
jgi:hypothetical protein